MRVETDEPEIVERIAALDVGKAEVVCYVCVPGPGAQRMQEVRTIGTMTTALLGLGDWLAELGVSRVLMEATSDYWRPPFYLLEDRFETWLVNAHDVKHVPGRPKTDRLDAVWLCKVAERQMLRPSFVPPPAIRQLRDLTRYRVDLLAVRTGGSEQTRRPPDDQAAEATRISNRIRGLLTQIHPALERVLGPKVVTTVVLELLARFGGRPDCAPPAAGGCSPSPARPPPAPASNSWTTCWPPWTSRPWWCPAAPPRRRCCPGWPPMPDWPRSPANPASPSEASARPGAATSTSSGRCSSPPSPPWPTRPPGPRTTANAPPANATTPPLSAWGVPKILDTSSDLRGCVHARAAE